MIIKKKTYYFGDFLLCFALHVTHISDLLLHVRDQILQLLYFILLLVEGVIVLYLLACNATIRLENDSPSNPKFATRSDLCGAGRVPRRPTEIISSFN